MKSVKEWYKLSNGYWMKIEYIFERSGVVKIWHMDVIVGKTRRICNDAANKSENSPKRLTNKSTNHHMNGIEALSTALKSLCEFEKTRLNRCEIHINGSDDQRCKVYRRLLRYGYTELGHYSPGSKRHKKPFYVKAVGEA